jgi:signal transduction histidine kinase
VLTLRDETARVAAEVEREHLLQAERLVHIEAERARAAAVLADRAKSEFLATMSHEFRTPLNAQIGYLQLIDLGLAGPVTDQQREYLERLRSCTHHLLGLVNDVLDLATADAGQISAAREHAMTGPALDAAVAFTLPQADAKGVLLVDDKLATPGVPYVGDEHRVRQIVVNLLANAVKFTERGGRVEVESLMVEEAPPNARVSGGGPWAVIRVLDTGIGIEPENQERVFDAFHQVEGGPTRTKGGTGLGLAISRRLARLMGGDVTLESIPGVGSTFALWLPAAGGVTRGEGGREETAPARSARARSEVTGDQAHGLDEVGAHLRANVQELVASFTGRLRSDRVVGDAAHSLDHATLETYYGTFLADLCQLLTILGQTHGVESPLFQDGNEIQRLVCELHGRRRHQLGWTEAQLRREYDILREEVVALVRRRRPEEPGDVPTAVDVIARLVAHAGDTAIRAFRRAARAASP